MILSWIMAEHIDADQVYGLMTKKRISGIFLLANNPDIRIAKWQVNLESSKYRSEQKASRSTLETHFRIIGVCSMLRGQSTIAIYDS
jgi:hypothetical protein